MKAKDLRSVDLREGLDEVLEGAQLLGAATEEVVQHYRVSDSGNGLAENLKPKVGLPV